MANKFDISKLHLQSQPVQWLCAILLAIFLMAIGYFALFQGQMDELTAAQEKEESLKTEFSEKSVRAASLDNLKLELQQIEESTQVLLKQLPTSEEIPTLIQELHQAAAKNNLTMSSVKPEKKVVEGPIERLPFLISVTGSYDQIAQFARDVGQMSRIVTLANISITDADEKSKTPTGKLTFSAMANTYKALDVSEMASAASAASAAGQ